MTDPKTPTTVDPLLLVATAVADTAQEAAAEVVRRYDLDASLIVAELPALDLGAIVAKVRAEHPREPAFEHPPVAKIGGPPPIDLDALEVAEKEATPGPWEADAEQPDDVVVWAPGAPDEDGASGFLMNVGSARIGQVGVAFDADTHNAALIAAARNALPTLIDELRRLRGVVERLSRLTPEEEDRIFAHDAMIKGFVPSAAIDQEREKTKKAREDADATYLALWRLRRDYEYLRGAAKRYQRATTTLAFPNEDPRIVEREQADDALTAALEEKKS